MKAAGAGHASRPLLVIGANGQVGHELLRSLAPLGPLVGATRDVLDLADPDAIRRYLRTLAPRLIVNAAAYTTVDKAEDEPQRAHAINAVAPGVLAEEAARLGAGLIHYSTDYVFSGEAHAPYGEDDETAPQCVYGRTKLAGEQAVLAAGGAALVLRTSWVYGLRGHNFLLTMQSLARSRPALRVVQDQQGTPTWSALVAQTTSAILAGLGMSVPALHERRGIYHLSAAGATTWCDFARAILAAHPDTAGVEVEGISSAEYPTRAKRPAYSVLDTTRLSSTFGLHMPDWHASLRVALSEQSDIADCSAAASRTAAPRA